MTCFVDCNIFKRVIKLPLLFNVLGDNNNNKLMVLNNKNNLVMNKGWKIEGCMFFTLNFAIITIIIFITIVPYLIVKISFIKVVTPKYKFSVKNCHYSNMHAIS